MIIYGLYIGVTEEKTFVYCEPNSVLLAGKSKIDRNTFLCRGNKKVDNWNPPLIEWFKDDGRDLSKFRDPDIAYIFGSSSFLINPKRIELLRPTIENEAELLPVPFNGGNWYFMNVFNHINALDKAKSRYKIYSSGKVGPLQKAIFLPEKLPHAKLFMIPERPSRIYYAEHYPDDNPNTFKNVLESNNLYGIALDPVQEL